MTQTIVFPKPGSIFIILHRWQVSSQRLPLDPHNRRCPTSSHHAAAGFHNMQSALTSSPLNCVSRTQHRPSTRPVPFVASTCRPAAPAVTSHHARSGLPIRHHAWMGAAAPSSVQHSRRERCRNAAHGRHSVFFFGSKSEPEMAVLKLTVRSERIRFLGGVSHFHLACFPYKIQIIKPHC